LQKLISSAKKRALDLDIAVAYKLKIFRFFRPVYCLKVLSQTNQG
jgi:hypothetical protein